MVGDRYEPFEYDIPWCSRNTLQVSGKGNRHTFALTVLAAAGLPYQDITTGSGGTQQWGAWQRTKTYQRVDVRYALHQQLPGHPLLRRLDIYVDLRNLLYLVDYFSSTYSEDSWHTFDNAVEYVWAADGRGEPLYMNDWALVLGLRGYFGVERRSWLHRRRR